MSLSVVEVLSRVDRPTVVMGLTNLAYSNLKSILGDLIRLGIVEVSHPPGDMRLRDSFHLTAKGVEVLRLWMSLRPLLGLRETYALEVLSRW